MEFREIREKLEGIVFDTLRLDEDGHFEAVVIKDELANLTDRLEKIFGPPVCPSKGRLLSQVQELIKDFGGVWPGQTLYFWNDGSDTIFAMLWPWQDGYHITLKIIRK